MTLAAFEAVAKAMHDGQVRYLVAGGLAVNAHGYIRTTADIDIVIALDADNIQRAFRALAGLNYRPSVPVTADAFTQPEQRQRWQDEKHMQVLNFYSDDYPGASVDMFVYEPFDFTHEYERALQGELLPGVVARFVSVPTLLEMKRTAGRPRDLDDIHHLRLLHEEVSNE